MQIHISGDKTLTGAAPADIEALVERALSRFGAQVTRVEVHLTDENSTKGGADDKHCAMEARLEGLKPVGVTHNAPTVDAAVRGATDKLKRALTSSLGKLRNRDA